MDRALESMSLVLRAASFAADKHRDQRRKGEGAPPYINHPIEVARVLVEVGGVTDPPLLAAALLHDTIEDTDTSFAELEGAFGQEVSALVAEVTDDKRLHWRERKRLQEEHAAHRSPRAKLLKLADKICNVRDLTIAPPSHWQPMRRREYLEWAARVVAGLRGSNDALEAMFDTWHAQGLSALDALTSP
jgi:guanosine-3',5'-bis(diphosphate) 3'-pyrophosphohydrolase